MDGTMLTSFAGGWLFRADLLMVLAAVLVPSGSWNTLLDEHPVGMMKKSTIDGNQ
jgi:hypothetical protein